MAEPIQVSEAKARELFAIHIQPHIDKHEYKEVQVKKRRTKQMGDGVLNVWAEIQDTKGRAVAYVQYFLNPDGSIGASGKKDPKNVCVDGVWHYVL